VSSPGPNQIPTPRDSARQLQGEDFVTLVLRLQRELAQVRRDLGQRGQCLSWSVTTPTVPASTVAATNNNAKAVTVYIRGGTVTNITIDGVATGFTSGTFRVNPGDGISITYSVAPTWFWYGD
jgi:hypothetical protein